MSTSPASDSASEVSRAIAADAGGRVTPEVAGLLDGLGRLHAAGDLMRAALAQELGISTHKVSALGVIGAAGETTPKAVAAALAMTTGSVTGLIDGMVSAGLVERQPNPRDRRSILLSLTAEGRAARRRIVEYYTTAILVALDDWPEGADLSVVQEFFDRFTLALTPAAR
ncbi:MarR family winged helix-turn-helix transcriptional regulator [Nocardioides rotundus]|uniref:MarR family winged helix-turn-helix transcriptional regulator n=1 Tax=Nocardioides rotundus TaxID=1774216 RepID=UPI001CC178EE|nr:MarR family winged helix-turn-helix transcriptional regulator [Nocardioides rotundus]UAL29368.1 MarR family winged helix-turn-helix transcriptional regulator [Nocardioides rotundus]